MRTRIALVAIGLVMIAGSGSALAQSPPPLRSRRAI